ncbi:choline/carnitine O-acyltransferase [Lactobacillus sp. LC28-10]|uniref:Choline/carnitine O-acyltransferase n=1 Tax=Secundilactobacillus angelensis TaxID=2722706 RepID=A0ABX1KXC6_9LACO|nr:choline/carnitine O-acyltransferase [Secundilactobacillus angelensis]MCH5461580.1 choline/carnitine O-acyltransferase [Secundilactobacillus angelensis]NLR17875.1 choline/carnitine O-acyltransferase [Secundilactobacillus angelensis]
MTGKYSTDLLTQLPKLPLPELDDTLTRLQNRGIPLLGASQQKKLAAQITSFKENDAPELQALLKQRWAETNANWLSPLLRHHALINREPLQNGSNFAFTVSHDRLPSLDQVTMAAKLLQNFADQYLAYVSEKIPVDTNSDNQPQDMDQYGNFFRTQRQANISRDYSQRTRPTLTNVAATIIYHNTAYQVRLIDHAGRVSTLHSLAESLTQIMQETVTDTFFVGAYSGLPRNTAAKLRSHLASNQHNWDNLTRISNSLLVLTLEDAEVPLTAQATLLGPQNRFFDKTTQVIVSSEPSLGFVFEHSQIDELPALKLADSVVSRLNQPEDQWDSKGKPHFERLTWELDHYTKEALSEADRNNGAVAKHLTFASTTNSTFGANRLQKIGIDPDAFLQIGFALAEFQATGGWQNISELVPMRGFYQGRTETLSTIDLEKKQFIEAFATGQRDAALKQAFNQAITAHTKRVQFVSKGLGIKGHLLGLQEMMLRNGGEKAFPDAANLFSSDFFNEIFTDFFTTINVPSNLTESFVSAPSHPTGYGIYYSILDSQLKLTVSAWQANSFTAQE